MQQQENKDRWAWLKRSDHNYLIPFVIVTTTGVALWLLFFAHNSVLNWVKASIDVKSQEKEMQRLQREIEQMDKEIDNLRNNRDLSLCRPRGRRIYSGIKPGGLYRFFHVM